jgi:hypothetical protein
VPGYRSVRLRQVQHDRFIETSGCAEVEIFDGRLLTQLGSFESQRQPTAVAGFGFAIDQQPEALLETQAQIRALLELFAQTQRQVQHRQYVGDLG